MTKQEAYKALTDAKEENTFRRTARWEKAFELYKAANPGSHKHMSCGSCYRDVLAWLRA